MGMRGMALSDIPAGAAVPALSAGVNSMPGVFTMNACQQRTGCPDHADHLIQQIQ